MKTRPDRFGYYPRAWALANLIATTPPPFTAGIFAEWGRGKTTLLETVAFLVTHAPQTAKWQKVLVLRYRPWLFRLETFEDVWLSMIEDIRGQVQKNADVWDQEARITFLKTSRTARLLRASSHAFGALGATGVTGLSQASKFLGKLVKDLTEDGVPKASHTLFSENRDALEALCAKSEPRHKSRVLLLVDDLDRCHPDLAIEILRAIHVFARSPNLVCLLAMDRDALLSSLAAKYGSREQANEYLHKVIQLAVTPRRVSGQRPEGLIESVLRGFGDDLATDKQLQVPSLKAPPPVQLTAPDDWNLRCDPWRDFLLRSLCFNPRSFEQFKLIYDFRWSVLSAELPPGIIPDPLKTAAQAVIELRWSEWNWVAYRFPEAERRFKELMRLRAQGRVSQTDQADSETLVREFPILQSFLQDHGLCSFYQEYYRLRSPSVVHLVTSGPGFIRIRNRSIQTLARHHSFPEVASYLISGGECSPAESPFLRAALDVISDNRSSEKEYRTNVHLQSPQDLVSAALKDLEDVRWDVADPVAEAGFLWGKILKVVTREYRSGSVASSQRIPYEFLAVLSNRRLDEEALRRLEIHMSLQIESPASPSSQAVRGALDQGQRLVQVIRKGCDAFWQKNHGLASTELAKLLLAWRDKPISDIKRELMALVSEGRKIPGFGSHEHKGNAEDPRVPVYSNLWKDVAGTEVGAPLDQTAKNLQLAFHANQQETGKPILPVNPDFYMALLHLACDIPSERIPLSFLLARMVGWASSYVEHQKSAGRIGEST